MRKRTVSLWILAMIVLAGCGPSMGGGGMPMGYGMMGMPMGGFYGGSWGHTNVYAYDHTTDVYAASHNNTFVNNHGGDYYHPGHGR